MFLMAVNSLPVVFCSSGLCIQLLLSVPFLNVTGPFLYMPGMEYRKFTALLQVIGCSIYLNYEVLDTSFMA